MMAVNLVWQGNSLTSAAWNIIKFFITYISAPKHPQFTTCMKTFLPLITHKIPFFTKSAEKNLWKKPHYTWCTHMIESTCHTHTPLNYSRVIFFCCKSNNDFNFCCSKADRKSFMMAPKSNFSFKLKIYGRYLSIWPLNPTRFVWKSTLWWYHCPFRIIFISYLLPIPTIYLNCRLLAPRCARSIWT